MVCQKCKENNLVEVASAHTVKAEKSKVAVAESHFAGVAESHLVKSGTPLQTKDRSHAVRKGDCGTRATYPQVCSSKMIARRQSS